MTSRKTMAEKLASRVAVSYEIVMGSLPMKIAIGFVLCAILLVLIRLPMHPAHLKPGQCVWAGRGVRFCGHAYPKRIPSKTP